jgi:hypothetical protein
LAPRLAAMFVSLEQRASQIFSAEGLRWPGIYLISGFRSRARQVDVNPLVPTSLHTRCPSMAGDLRVGDTPASTTAVEVWAFLGAIWKALGGRWGGDFRPEPDLNHFEELSVGVGPVTAATDRAGDPRITAQRPTLLGPSKQTPKRTREALAPTRRVLPSTPLAPLGPL